MDAGAVPPVQGRRLRLLACGVGAFALALLGASCKGRPEAVLTVVPDEEAGSRKASLRLQTSHRVTDVAILFELPTECHVTAGALERDIAELTAKEPRNQILMFVCPDATAGNVSVNVTWKDESGETSSRRLESKI
jgi:hypothetical protein